MLGYGYTFESEGRLKVVRGIVSSLPARTSNAMLEINSVVNPGNSGGPLLDQSGHVLGMVTEKLYDRLHPEITPLGRAIAWFTWCNEYRPHTRLAGKTPNEVRFNRKPANELPRIEPRATWTPKMKCARPHAAHPVLR